MISFANDTDTIAALLIPDIFLIAALFIHKDRISVLIPLTLHLLCPRSDFVLLQNRML